MVSLLWLTKNTPFFVIPFVPLFRGQAVSWVLKRIIFFFWHEYVNFLLARKNNLPSDVTGVSWPPLPRHLPTAARGITRCRPSRSDGCRSLWEIPASALAVSALSAACQDSSKYSRKGWGIHWAWTIVQEIPWSKNRAMRHHHTESLPPPRQAPCRTRQTPPDRIQAEMFA